MSRSPAAFVGIFLLAIVTAFGSGAADVAQVVEACRIWDAGPHNAFPDLIRWHERWWCTFRESEGHVGGDGNIRVICSGDGATWESAALIGEKDIDLRDPKLSVTADGRLMIVAGGSVYLGTKQLKGRQPRVMFSADGKAWTPPQRVLDEGDWLWRVTWHEGTAYGVSYRAYSAGPTTKDLAASKPAATSLTEWTLRLVRSTDGVTWETIGPMEASCRPNETTLRFTKDGRLLALVRREAGTRMGWLGVARPPYKQWTWHELDHQLGGPNFIELPDGILIAGTRDYTTKPTPTTLVARLTDQGLEPLATLPSGGDCSYPGLAWHEGVLWVVYYSSHEGKTNIYLAKVKLPADMGRN